jgi:hypothetical protein
MKTSITLFALFITVSLLIVQSFNQRGFTNVSGAPAGRVGSPFEGSITCNVSGCHTGFPLGSRPGWITSNIPGNGYVPGQTYTITAMAVSSASCIRFGFEISPQTSSGANAGTMIITNATLTHFASAAAPNNMRWITHTLSGSSAASTPGTKTWSFDWTAPVSGTGTVTFYGAFNRANNSNSTFGDSIFTSQLVVPESPTGIWDAANSDYLLTVYPVPASEHLFVNLKLRNNLLPQIQLTDISGSTIRSLADAATSAQQEYTFDVNIAGLDAGIYFIRVIQGSTVSVRKIIIL